MMIMTTDPGDLGDTNVMIEQRDQTPLYGLALANRIIATGKGLRVKTITGISYECFIVYLFHRYPNCKEVRESYQSIMTPNGLTRRDLLPAIDDKIELTVKDALEMYALQKTWEIKFGGDADQQQRSYRG